MAQNIILKRSALPGKIPTTSSLNVGEIAVNTYDGKLFIKRSGSIESIEEVITTNAINTGSITLTQTGSFGELVVSNDANIQRDLYVTQDIIGNGNIDLLGDITGSSVLLNGGLIVSGATTIANNLTVLGNVNAKQFNISVISSSILFESGSSNFGNSVDDTHTFTGSVEITGSLLLNGIELGGSSNSGSFTGSFTGSFIGDGSGLRGVISDELPRNGYDYNVDDIGTINDFNATSSRYLIDFDIDALIGTPVGHKTYITNFDGSTKVIPAGEAIIFQLNDAEVARIDGNGFSGSLVLPSDLVSGSSQLTSSYDNRYVLSGSITQTTWDNIASKPSGIISGSSQLTASYDNRYAASGSVGGSGVNRRVELYTATSDQTIFNVTASVSSGNVDVHINGYKLPSTDFVVTDSNTITLTTGSNAGELVEIAMYQSYFGEFLTEESLELLNQFTASNENTSLNSYTSSNDILNSLQTTRIDQLAELTASNATTNNTQNTRLTTLESVTGSYATTGSNTFRGTQTLSGSIIPATDNTYDLGSATYQWRDIYVSSGSLYIDGAKVLGSTGNELQITTDDGQSIKILEAGSDNIILQSADGDIQLKTSGGGNLLFDPTTGLIDVRGTFQIQDGYKITSSGGNAIQFGDDLGITGSITTTGNINGVNVSNLQSTFNTYTGSSNTSLTDLNTYTASVKNAINVIGEGNSSVTTVYGNLVVEGTTLTVSASNLAVADNMIYLNDGNEITDPDLGIAGNYNDGNYRHAGIFSDASDSHTWKVYKGYQPEPSQSIDTTHGTFTLADFQAGTLKGAIAATNGVVSGSSQITFSEISSLPTLVSGSSQVIGILSSLNTYTGSNDTTNTTQNSRLTSIESVTGSYETKGRSIVSGSSQITLSSTTGYGSVLNQAVLTTSSPTFADISANSLGVGEVKVTSNQIYRNSSNEFYVNYSGTGNTMLGNGTGNVSVGAGTSPSYKLHLGGTLGVTGASTLSSTTINGNITMNPGTGDLGSRYLTINKGASNDGGILMSRDNSYDWQIINSTSTGDLSFYSYGTNSNPLVISKATGVITADYGFNIGNAKIRWGGNTTPTLGFPFTAAANAFWIDVNDGDTGGIVVDNDGTTIYGAGDAGYVFRVIDEDVYQGNSNVTSSTTFQINQGVNGGGYVRGAFEVTGNLTVGGTLTENSSLRYKKDVVTIENGLDKVLKMRGVTYVKKDNDVKEVGVIAEEISEILPDLVKYNTDGQVDSVSYGRITAVLIEAIKEQQKQIEELKALIK